MSTVTPWSVISTIAEKRIEDAVKKGDFDNIPGQGKPLVLEDMSNVAPELRMAYKILRNAGCLPPELEERKEIGRLVELLDDCSDEQEKLKQIQKIRFLIQRGRMRYQRAIMLEEDDPYYAKILAHLDRTQAILKNKPTE